MMVVFGLVHLPAYMAQEMQSLVLALAIVLAAVIGLLLGLIYLRTGSLWLPRHSRGISSSARST
jgi:membrane protease YdiL (CAAX protease family)